MRLALTVPTVAFLQERRIMIVKERGYQTTMILMMIIPVVTVKIENKYKKNHGGSISPPL